MSEIILNLPHVQAYLSELCSDQGYTPAEISFENHSTAGEMDIAIMANETLTGFSIYQSPTGEIKIG